MPKARCRQEEWLNLLESMTFPITHELLYHSSLPSFRALSILWEITTLLDWTDSCEFPHIGLWNVRRKKIQITKRIKFNLKQKGHKMSSKQALRQSFANLSSSGKENKCFWSTKKFFGKKELRKHFPYQTLK